jgi:undecaprenol kinase
VSSELKDKQRRIGFSYAWNGIKEISKTEYNFRIHLIAAVFAIVAGFIFRLSNVEWAIIVLVIGLVLMAELINSVIEKMIDYLKPEIHPSAKIIKDVAAGVVLITAIIALIVGLLIFLPKLDSIL